MGKAKLQTLKGFRDFLPEEAKNRQYAIDIIQESFESFGFEPLETPALEYQEVLLDKYGQEADRLVYKFQDLGGRKVALRYDQTVPTARIIAMYHNSLPMPWRRYQIQPVWRAEKPQKGRFREFLQCDADIFGTTSLLADGEIIAMTNTAFQRLGFEKIKVLINDRTILFDLMKKVPVPKEYHLSLFQSIDKLGRKTKKEVQDELVKKGLTKKQIDSLFKLIEKATPTKNLDKVIDSAVSLGVEKSSIEFRPFLSRGLDYYTSTIFEFEIEGYQGGSVAGGGRYDNLINKLGGVSIPAVGISFGFDRLIEAMEQSKLLPKAKTNTSVLVTIFSPKHLSSSIEAVNLLRKGDIKAELYPDPETKLNKQLKYADKKGIPWAVIIGPNEVLKNSVVLKNLKTKSQETIPVQGLLTKIR